MGCQYFSGTPDLRQKIDTCTPKHRHGWISVSVSLYISADIIHILCQLRHPKHSVFILRHGMLSFLKVKGWYIWKEKSGCVECIGKRRSRNGKTPELKELGSGMKAEKLVPFQNFPLDFGMP